MDLKGDQIVHLVGKMRRGLSAVQTCRMLDMGSEIQGGERA